MTEVRSDLVIRLDEGCGRLIFFLRSKSSASAATDDQPSFYVEISFDELCQRGPDGAEKLVGESVLGFFDTLTAGRLDLPRHYVNDSDEDT